MVSDSVRAMIRMSGRQRGRVAALRELQAALPDVAPLSADDANKSQPRWLSREALHERIFQRIAELQIPLDKDRLQ